MDLISKKSQIWSYDIIAAISVFLVAFIIFYSMLGSTTSTEKTSVLSDEGSLIATVTNSGEVEGNLSFIKGESLKEREFKKFVERYYNETRRELGVTTDFCIHFEDEDGNIINLSSISSTLKGVPSTIGSSKINITLDDGETLESFNCGNG